MGVLAQSQSNAGSHSADEPLLLHEFFARAAQRFPERTALDIPPGVGRPARRRLTYAELDGQSNALAACLRPLVTGECVVAILLPRRTEHLYNSQLATLKAGAAYTCIDPAFPDEQVRDILKDSDAVALLTDCDGLARLDHFEFDRKRTFDVAELIRRLQPSPLALPPPHPLTPEHLAYIIYTSGTTGRPKGVMIEHRSIVNLVASDIEEFKLAPDDRIGQSSSPAYDSSLEETWLGFAAGATVVVMDDETTRLGPDLVGWLQRERITVLCPPPTLLRTTGCHNPDVALPELSLLYVGGEALPRDVADHWAKGRRLENGYGPTECTVTALRGRIYAGQAITIGRPLRNLHAWVLNDALEEVADGQQGELCLGGVGLARGYRNRPELTAQKFPTHPRLGRIYRTGDLVHRDQGGQFHYHGRIDSQVKLRGYRVELEAIEARLAECDGVREAACCVQGNGAKQMLVAFIVLEDGHAPSFDELKVSLRKALPAYMVPSRFAVLDQLPTSVGGKLNRNELPPLDVQSRNGDREAIAPRNEMEEKIAAAFSHVLHAPDGVSIHEDFFNDLGGDSLHAAELISLLRDEPSTESITVRDLYEAHTVAELAQRARVTIGGEPGIEPDFIAAPERTEGRPILATIVQSLWLLLGVVLVAAAAYGAAFQVLPFLIGRLGLIPFLLSGPVLLAAGFVLYTPLAVLIATAIKKILIGRYRPLRAPVWGSFYVRNWMVQQAVRLVPWRMLEGTEFQLIALRLLGARIGRRVHLHRGVQLLHGGWDLLDIGDDVMVGQDASLRLVDYDDGQVVVGAIVLGAGSTLDIRAGVDANTRLEPEAYLTALSSLPEGGVIPQGECWDGIPATYVGPAPLPPSLADAEPRVSPFRHATAMLLAQFGLRLVLALIWEMPTIAFALCYGVNTESALDWLYTPTLNFWWLVAVVLLVSVPVPFMLAVEGIAMRALGRVPVNAISRWSFAYIRIWLKAQMVQTAGEWLSGTLFWPMWLRWAGMKIGRGCEISTIIDVVPELIEIGRESFFADGIYLGGPRLHRGTVTLEQTRLGNNTFLGNHAVIPVGQQLPDDVLLGVCTVADDRRMRAGTSWFGQPPFELPRREIVECDRRYTHEPSLIRYLNRMFWELLRFALPVTPVLILPLWFKLLADAEVTDSWPVFIFVVVPLLSMGVAAFFCLLVLALKWLLLGRVRPGLHPLWSCWCSRWDFLYVAWGVYASSTLVLLEGTLWLSWYLRAMGAHVGRRVVLGGGYAQVVDPDMLHFEDGATVNCQFQAHTFEDRVLKIDHVYIRRRASVGNSAVLLYGADIGAHTTVAPHSVVMKRESLLPGHAYSGCPTRPIQAVHHADIESPELFRA